MDLRTTRVPNDISLLSEHLGCSDPSPRTPSFEPPLELPCPRRDQESADRGHARTSRSLDKPNHTAWICVCGEEMKIPPPPLPSKVILRFQNARSYANLTPQVA